MRRRPGVGRICRSENFISYARSTADQAQQVAEALRGLGYGVWRDDELPAHRSYAEVIEERLQSAKAVVVIWSAEAVKSEWVQSEADRARGDHKLVPLHVDDAALPMPFDRIQCADMAGWAGDLEAPGWRKVVASIADLAGQAEKSAAAGPAPAPKRSICVPPFLLNDPDAALGMLGPVLERDAGNNLDDAKMDPDFEGLRDDPRFQAMIAAAEARLAAAKTP